MTDEKNTQNTTPETAKPEPTLTDPVEQSFAEAERLAEQAEAAAADAPCCEPKDEPCCDMPKEEEAAAQAAPKTEVPPQPQYQPPQYTYAAYTAQQPQQSTPQEGTGDYRPPRYTEQYQANANNANYNYNNPQQTYYAPNGQPQYGQNYAQPYDPPQGTKSRIAAGVLAILFGAFGVHNFYIGKTGLGIAQLAITICSCGTLAIVSEIWGIVEGVRLLQGTIYTDGHGMKFVD